MATATYIALANTTLSSAASSVTFSSIPATYRDLVAVINVVGLSGSPTSKAGKMKLNSLHGSDVFMYGNGSSGSSGSDASTVTVPFQNNHGVFIINIMDYSATDKHKTILGRHSVASNFVWANAGRVATTNAITSVEFICPDTDEEIAEEASDTFNIGSTFSLYGIIA
jgi:hypothetical protein